MRTHNHKHTFYHPARSSQTHTDRGQVWRVYTPDICSTPTCTPIIISTHLLSPSPIFSSTHRPWPGVARAHARHQCCTLFRTAVPHTYMRTHNHKHAPFITQPDLLKRTQTGARCGAMHVRRLPCCWRASEPRTGTLRCSHGPTLRQPTKKLER
jgi:hypothetical protein